MCMCELLLFLLLSYDLSRKVYLLKFVRPDQKLFVVIESGIRVHSTQFTREKNDIPSVFAMKVQRLRLNLTFSYVSI
jgi:predicted ribosome quality control (RQC) complex YloA/Tae2 family protein